jgi:hypothetical protein
LVPRIQTEVTSASNILVSRILSEVASTCNTLIGRINDTSNYVVSSSNIISKRISDLNTDLINIGTNNRFIVNDEYNRNFTVNGNLIVTSNLTVYGNETRLETYVYTTEKLEVVNINNNLVALMVQQNNSSSNDIFIASNQSSKVFNITKNGDVNIIGTYKINNRDITQDTSNYITSASNILVPRIISEVTLASNILVPRIQSEVTLASNILVPRIISEVTLASNILVPRILSEVTSTSNILVPRIISEVTLASNILVPRILSEVTLASNILVPRILSEVTLASNILVPRILSEVTLASNILVPRIQSEVTLASNILVPRILSEVASTSNTLIGRINDTSNYVRYTSNILMSFITTANLNSISDSNTSNYIASTSNILVSRILSEDKLTSNTLITALAGKQSTLTAGSGISIIGTTINSLWRNPAIFTTFASVNTSERVRIGSLTEAEALLQLTGNATNGGTLRLEYIGNTPNIEILRATGTASANYNWNILNDNSFKLQSKNLANSYASRFEISGDGNVGVGTTSSIPLHIYNATSSLLRLETSSTGKPSIEFVVGTSTDVNTDYRIINDAYELKFQYQDNLVSYGATESDIFSINDKGAMYYKPTYYGDGVGVKTPSDPLYSLDVSGDVRFLSGNVGIGVEPTTGPGGQYRLNVAGDVNIQGIGNKYYINNLPVVSSQWATVGTTIEYNGGSVGIGTAAFSYKLNVNGSINATSILVNGGGIDYNTLNNKPIILIPSTTNLQLASGYNFLVGGNVGIGTTASSTARLNILGDTQIFSPVITPTIPAVLSITPAPTSTYTPTNTLYRAAILTYAGTGTGTSYSVVIPAGGILCDILMVGGGGAGGNDIGAGGGGGAVLYATNILIKEGTYTLFVGRGATYGSGETKGQSTTGFGAILLGGGSAGSAVWANTVYANNGGAGSGGKSLTDEWSRRGGRPIVGGSIKGGILNSGTLYEGFAGGYGVQQISQVVSSGGGGAGAVGGNGATTSGSGGTAIGSSGGAGVSNTILDTTYFWGGGGGGGSYSYTTPPNGGAGGGGAGQNNNGGGVTATGTNGASSFFAVATAINGINGTGGGGGGTGYTTQTAGAGGAGVIIIRYRQPINNNQTINFLTTGTNGDLTVKGGMIGGEYSIQTTQSGSVMDRFKINASGATSLADDNIVVKGGTRDTLITNNCGIGIDPTSSYKLNVNGDININGNIYRNGFIATSTGFHATVAYSIRYSGNTNFLITTRARNCCLQIYIGDKYGHYNFRDMAVNEWRGNVTGGMSINGWSYYVPYITMQGDTPRPFVVWMFNGNNTEVLVVENWYN